MIKKLIEIHINNLFSELEKIAKEVAEIEIEKQGATSIKKLTEQSISKDVQKRVMAITMQLQILNNIEGIKSNA
jgi:hypothetical protein